MTRLLLITPSSDGVMYHRLLAPYGYLGRTYPDAYDIHSLPGLADVLENPADGQQYDTWGYVALFDAVVCSRMLHTDTGRQAYLISKIKETGAKLIVDIDDYWMLNANHLLYADYKRYNIPGAMIQLMKAADRVTTSQAYLAQKIKPYNASVSIVPNCIDGDMPQFIPAPTASDRVRVGWIGGVHHLDDLALIKDSIHHLLSEPAYSNKVQFVFGGFNVHDKLPVDEQVFVEMERRLTNNYTLITDGAYRRHLCTYSPDPYPGEENQPYRRLWARGVEQYATMYNAIDIALAPLCDNEFNRCKSQLKITEAGWFGKPVVASDIYPYRIDDIVGVQYVSQKKHKEFYTAIKALIDSPNLRTRCGELIQQYVHARYTMKDTIDTRINIIKQTLKKHEPITA